VAKKRGTDIIFREKDKPLTVREEPGDVLRLLQADEWVELHEIGAGEWERVFVARDAIAYIKDGHEMEADDYRM
jgi:hypothetical protein